MIYIIKVPKTQDELNNIVVGKRNIELNQEGEAEYVEETDTLNINYNQLKVATIQLDFYGPDALTYCNYYKQVLKMNFQVSKGQGLLDLKKISDIRDLTFLEPNKHFCRRYNFDIEAYIVDTIQISSQYIDSATIQIVNRGNGEG